MNKLLIIGHQWPEPTSSAAGQRMMQLISCFQTGGFEVEFACAADRGENAVDLKSIQVKTHSIQLNHSSFDAFVSELNPQAVMFDRFMTEEQYGWRVQKNCPEAIRVLDTEDLHCLRHARQLALKAKRPLERCDFITDLAKREIASIFRCDLSLIISEFEMQWLQMEFQIPPQIIHCLPFMVDLEGLKLPNGLDYEQRQHFISIGNFLHAPNWDAVQFLKSEIWPLIRLKLPHSELHIYGAYSDQKVHQLNDVKSGFFIKGRAEDAIEVIGKSRVLLAPLRFGAGLKGKLLDAMLAGTPSVTTSIGAESMHKNLPWNGAIEDQPEKFVESAILLYNDNQAWRKAQSNGFEIVRKVFDKKNHQSLILGRIEQLKSTLKVHRESNFIGSMLHHHNHRSTEYMSKWIEAKEKANR